MQRSAIFKQLYRITIFKDKYFHISEKKITFLEVENVVMWDLQKHRFKIPWLWVNIDK